MEIYIVRHGTTAWNEKRIMQGKTDIPLNEAGRQVAILTGENLKDVSFDKIYSSPLSRAYETAELIRADREIPIIKDDRLREVNFGIFEGKSALALQKDEMSALQCFFKKPEEYIAPKGCESLEDVCKRTKQFLQEVIEPQINDTERIMIVGHGAMNRAMMCYVKNHELKDYWSGGLQTNCGVIIIKLDKNGYQLIEENKVFY